MILKTLSILTIPVLLAAAGCEDTRQVRTTRAYGMTETSPQGSDNGYVEFHALKTGAPVPIFGVDSNGRSHMLGAVGLKEGDPYSRARYEGDVSEKLRVAVPPGNNNFTIERNGPRIQVPVSSGQVTPVEVYYNRIEKGFRMDIYRANAEILAQTAATDIPSKK
ncbi:MAG TPA: hypothetical protein VMZ27_07715 [Candidatus Saccharimonadales bacterium]|nr:hypothetical protein [Candidatus Saccharimonadales bacterium]